MATLAELNETGEKAIEEAILLEGQPEEKSAWKNVSGIYQEIADQTKSWRAEGRLARLTAVDALKKSGDVKAACNLIAHYMTEAKCN